MTTAKKSAEDAQVVNAYVPSLRERLLAAEDLGQEEVYVPQWKQTLLVKGMTTGVRDDIVAASRDEDNQPIVSKFHGLVVIATTYDPETGEKVFTNADLIPLLQKNPGAIDTLFDGALKASGMTEAEALGTGSQIGTDEAGKGSSSIRNGDFSS